MAVEFFRIQSRGCFDDVSGQPIRGSDFVYGNTTCNLTCSVDLGPTSPMRGGSADNIYVVPIPNIIGFGTATLIAAACCIPGVLSIVSTWNKILKSNWTKQFGVPETDEVIEGTNGATLKGMKGVNDVIRRLLSVVEVPVVRTSPPPFVFPTSPFLPIPHPNPGSHGRMRGITRS